MNQWTLHSLKTIFTTFDPELYIPITFLSFKIESLFGMNAWLFHLDNLLLHIANGILVAWILIKLTRSRIAGVCAALIFAVHPINAETVVWISARKDLLATFFGLLSIMFAMRKSARLSIIFFTLAALSKISVVMLPLLLMVLTMQDGRRIRDNIKILAPLFAIAITLGVVALVGKGSEIGSASVIERIVLAGYAISLSISHFLLPAHIGLYYTLPAINTQSILIAMIPLLLIVCAWIVRKKLPLVSIGIVWFFVFIIPTVFNIQTDIRSPGVTFASDRYLYLPSIGLLIAIVAVAMEVGKRMKREQTKNIALALTSLLVIIFIPVTRAQVATWNNADMLFAHALVISPQSVQARVSLAESLKQEGKIEEAFAILKQGLQFSDDPRLHLEAGVLYAAAGQVVEAEDQFKKVQAIEPRLVEAIYGIAMLRAHEGKKEEAEKLLRQAIELEPTYERAHLDLAELLAHP